PLTRPRPSIPRRFPYTTLFRSLGLELTPVNVRDTDEIERNMAAFARSGNGGVIVTTGGTGAHREFIISLAARYKLPSVHPFAIRSEEHTSELQSLRHLVCRLLL